MRLGWWLQAKAHVTKCAKAVVLFKNLVEK